jgi:hypothetical protein
MEDNKVEYGAAQLAVYKERPDLLKLNLTKAVDEDDAQEEI